VHVFVYVCMCAYIYTVSRSFKECAGSRLFGVHIFVYVCMCAYTYSVLNL
jgi:hypothetical protein